MNTIVKTKIAVALAAVMTSGVAGAVGTPMYIDLAGVDGVGPVPVGGSTVFGAGGDADTTTGEFLEFGFNQFLATSLYEKDGAGGSFTGNIVDTNVGLAALGFPTGGLVEPTYGQTTLGNLSPLTPPAGVISDAEGFGVTWGLVVEYNITGNIPTDGTNFTGLPEFTGGFYNVYFDDYSTGLGKDIQVLGLTLTGSEITAPNLDLFFDVNFALDGFLFVDDGKGGFKDVNDLVGSPFITFSLDTNVNPAIPDPASLVEVTDGVGVYGARQTTLDGSISPSVPEPGTLALLGAGLLGFAASRKRKAV